MGALTKTKTWTKDSILVVDGDQPAQFYSEANWDGMNRKLLFEVKEALIGTNGNWTVVSSCGYDGGGVFSYGAADYWSDASNIVWEYDGDFTWIILENNAIKTGFQILLALEQPYQNTESFGKFYVSPSGAFTGGTESARPTAVDEYVCVPNSYLFLRQSDTDKRANVLMSSDGECTRILMSTDGSFNCCWIIDKPVSGTGYDATVFEGVGLTGILDTSRNLTTWQTADFNRVARLGGRNIRWCGIVEGIAQDPLAQRVEMRGPDYAGNYPVAPLYAVAHDFGGRGILGKLFDLYNINSLFVDGDYVPAGGDMDWVVIQDYLFPNDGTVFEL